MENNDTHTNDYSIVRTKYIVKICVASYEDRTFRYTLVNEDLTAANDVVMTADEAEEAPFNMLEPMPFTVWCLARNERKESGFGV